LGRKFKYQTTKSIIGEQMESQSVSSPSQSTSQSQIPKYESCLLVTRHRLLQQQEDDLNKICEKVTKVDSLPTDINELKKTVDFYDAVVGVVPLPLQVQILQLRKSILLFYMESIGTAKSRQEAEQLLAMAGGEGVILPPAKEGEPFRVSIYKGIKLVKKIVVEDEFIIQH
jgi:hypothetical protein